MVDGYRSFFQCDLRTGVRAPPLDQAVPSLNLAVAWLRVRVLWPYIAREHTECFRSGKKGMPA